MVMIGVKIGNPGDPLKIIVIVKEQQQQQPQQNYTLRILKRRRRRPGRRKDLRYTYLLRLILNNLTDYNNLN